MRPPWYVIVWRIVWIPFVFTFAALLALAVLIGWGPDRMSAVWGEIW
jgi:hypothetical protein